MPAAWPSSWRGALEQPALILELLDGGIVVHALHHVLVEHLEAAGAVTGLGILRVGHALERQILAHEALALGIDHEAEVDGVPRAGVEERVGVAPTEVHDRLRARIHLGAHLDAHEVTVAGRAPAGIPPAGGSVVLGTGPGLHELGVGIVAARGEDDALAGVDPAVAAIGVLHDNAGDAVALADKLLGRSGEAQLEIVVLLGHFLHFQAHVDARVAGAHAGIRR